MELSYNKMKSLSEKTGSPYFSKDSIEFWNSKIESEADEHQLFIESTDDFYGKERQYRVKCIGLDGKICTISPNHFNTLAEAEQFRQRFEYLMGDYCDINHCEYSYEGKNGIDFEDVCGNTFTIDADDALKESLPVVKYTYEYKVNAGIDIELSEEEAEEAKEGSLDLKDKVDDAVVDMDFGEVEFERTGSYPEVLGLDGFDDPYIHSRIYGSYVVQTVGENEIVCRQKARQAFESAYLGAFAEESLEWEIETEKIKADCEIFISSVLAFRKEDFDYSAILAVNMDRSGYTIKAEPKSDSIDITVYKAIDEYNHLLPIENNDERLKNLSNKEIGHSEMSISEFEKAIRDISLSRLQDVKVIAKNGKRETLKSIKTKNDVKTPKIER